MLHEPYCKDEEWLARRTLYQLEYHYRRPMLRLRKELDDLMHDRAGVTAADDSLPSKEEFVGAMASTWGGDPAKWAEDYDRMAAEFSAAAEKAKQTQ